MLKSKLLTANTVNTLNCLILEYEDFGWHAVQIDTCTDDLRTYYTVLIQKMEE